MTKITGVVISYNEQDNIVRCLESLKPVVDEIVVIDSFSQDDTVTLAKAQGARVIQHKFEGHVQQKNYALSQCQTDYVLSLDADECLSDRLISKLHKMKSHLDADGYFFHRKNKVAGHWIRYSGWYPDKKLRLFNRLKGKWTGQNPHDKVEMIKGTKITTVPCDILHYTFETKEQHRKQIDYFSTIAAQSMAESGKKFSFLKPYLSSFGIWIKMMIFRTGFLDGSIGWYLAKESARARYLKYKKLERLNKSKN